MNTQQLPISEPDRLIIRAAINIVRSHEDVIRAAGIDAGIDGRVAETLALGRLDAERKQAADALHHYLFSLGWFEGYYGPQPEPEPEPELDEAPLDPEAAALARGLELVDDELSSDT